jgi:hypothetical protein
MKDDSQESSVQCEENLAPRSGIEENMEVVTAPTFQFDFRNREAHRNDNAAACRSPEEGNVEGISLCFREIDPETSTSIHVRPPASSRSPAIAPSLIGKWSLRSRRPFVPLQPSLSITRDRKHRYSIEQLFRERRKENQLKDRIEHIKQKLVTFDQNCEVTPDGNQFEELEFPPIERDLQHVGIFIQPD